MLHLLLQAVLFAAALADDPNDFSKYSKSVFIPYAHDFAPNKTPSINCTIKNKKYTVPVDTGSTGFIIGAKKVPDITEQGMPGTEYVASEGLLYSGRIVNMSINFNGEGSSYARSYVPVLIVDKSVKCTGYKTGDDCKISAEKDTSKILHLGVGFGLNNPDSSATFATPAYNPFLNIASVGGVHASGEKYRNGYTVSTKGITLGLTKQNTDQFNWIGLDKGTTSDPRDWGMVKTSFTVDGKGPYAGRAVIGTGTGAMFLQTSPQGDLPKESTSGKSKVETVKKGTALSFGFPSLGNDGLAGYNFKVGDDKFASQPSYVKAISTEGGPFVSTGRKFLYGFTVGFDAVGGRFGFKCLKCGGDGGDASKGDKGGYGTSSGGGGGGGNNHGKPSGVGGRRSRPHPTGRPSGKKPDFSKGYPTGSP